MRNDFRNLLGNDLNCNCEAKRLKEWAYLRTGKVTVLDAWCANKRRPLFDVSEFGSCPSKSFSLKKKNQIRISLIYRKMICLNLTLVIHFFPKNIEGFEFLLLIFKVVPLNKLMTP